MTWQMILLVVMLLALVVFLWARITLTRWDTKVQKILDKARTRPDERFKMGIDVRHVPKMAVVGYMLGGNPVDSVFLYGKDHILLSLQEVVGKKVWIKSRRRGLDLVGMLRSASPADSIHDIEAVGMVDVDVPSQLSPDETMGALFFVEDVAYFVVGV